MIHGWKCLTVSLLLCPVLWAGEGDYVTNGGMEEGEDFPSGWKRPKADEGEVRAFRDTADMAGGSASLRLESVDGPAIGKVSQPIRVSRGETLEIRCRAKASEGITHGALILLTQGSSRPWNEIVNFSATRTWTAFQRTFTVPGNTKNTLVLLFFRGEGSVWLDELEIRHSPPPPVTEGGLLTDFEKPFQFAYGSFEKATSVEGGMARILAADGRGGAGRTVKGDLSPFAGHSPALVLRCGDKNRADAVRLVIRDSGKQTRVFTYDLESTGGSGFTTLLPRDAAPLEGDGLDLRQIRTLQIQGNWRTHPVDLILDKVSLVAPTDAMNAERREAERRREEALERERRREEEREAKKRRLLSSGVEKRPGDGPEILHVWAAAPRLIGIEIQSGNISPASPEAYVAEPGDVIEESETKVLAWNDGKPALVPRSTDLMRRVPGSERLKRIGKINPKDGTLWRQVLRGSPIDLTAIDEPGAWRIVIDSAAPIQPAAVYRKSKPNSVALESGGVMSRHFVYLEMPEPLTPGSVYLVEPRGVNTREASISFTFDPESVRSESIHVSHIGYREDDPAKRAYLSLWTGTGGGIEFGSKHFHLLDEGGASVFRGEIRLGIPGHASEPFSKPRNHSLTDVYHLDFGDFTTPGTYRVHLPEIGVSYTFRIGGNPWREAFDLSMQGFLCHRSGIALGPPFSDYRRPKTMIPGENGFVVFKTDAQVWDGESDAIRKSLLEQLGPGLDPGGLEKHENAWGGYMDAGDWDRRSHHLVCSLRQLELLDLFPETARLLELNLPPGEAANDIPDLLDEALWNIDLFRRLQEPDGGVGGGIESTAHPRPAEASWGESLLVGAFRPDPETSYRFAAVAAKASRLLGEHPRARDLAEASVRAWNWAAENTESQLRAAIERKVDGASRLRGKVTLARAIAGVELYRLTGDARYHDALPPLREGVLNQLDFAMGYALLPENLADAERRRTAVAAIVAAADNALDFARKNGFNIALPSRYLPMMGFSSIWSTPGSTAPPVLPRAHFLTRDEKYLEGTLLSCLYSSGANPMNMSYTTGLGPRFPLAPLHIDSRISGQKPPPGITVYGQSDPSAAYDFNAFAHTWFLNRFGGVPSARWPTAEAYVDLGNWPSMNEYTVHQTLTNTAYTWGYLALRP